MQLVFRLLNFLVEEETAAAASLSQVDFFARFAKRSRRLLAFGDEWNGVAVGRLGVERRLSAAETALFEKLWKKKLLLCYVGGVIDGDGHIYTADAEESSSTTSGVYLEITTSSSRDEMRLRSLQRVLGVG